ncbi:MAG: aminotransferase class V-fold PLP-dependent enzyme, partial [Actinomycetota bacterium]
MSLYYFDHAASAPRRDEVSEAMAPFQHGVVGNPSGMHKAAREARRVIEDARDQIAAFVGAAPGQVVFTGGGTESCHMAIAGAANAYRRAHGTAHLITSAIEHHAGLHCFDYLAKREDFSVTVLPVDGEGRVSVEALQQALRPDTVLVSIMAANNEIGTLQPAAELGALCRERGVIFHTDAVQAFGKVPFDVGSFPVD